MGSQDPQSKGKIGGHGIPLAASSFPRQAAPGESKWVPELGTKNVTAFQNKREGTELSFMGGRIKRLRTQARPRVKFSPTSCVALDKSVQLSASIFSSAQWAHSSHAAEQGEEQNQGQAHSHPSLAPVTITDPTETAGGSSMAPLVTPHTPSAHDNCEILCTFTHDHSSPHLKLLPLTNKKTVFFIFYFPNV